MKWYYQYHPNDTWDLDTPHEHLLLTVERSGQQVPITFQPNKTGFYFSLDRNTGRFLAAKRFARFVNIWKDVNPENGKLIENAGMRPVAGTAPWTSARRSSVDAPPMPPITQARASCTSRLWNCA